MGNSRKSKLDSLVCRIETVLRQHTRQGEHLVAGLSGGADSVVLLDLLARLSDTLGFSLGAIHVNHGISPHAHAWEKFCRNLCECRGIPLEVIRFRIRKEPGTSLEAVARERRYQAFHKLKADSVVLAQHLDDQTETLLLQLLRGAGVRGLAAMPVIRQKIPSRREPAVLRPLLEVSRDEIERYAQERGLAWVNDESNADIAYSRNFLRHEVLPVLERHFPAYRITCLRTSKHMAEASALLDEMAESDGQGCLVPGGIQISGLRTLSLARARNLLRYVFVKHHAVLPGTARLDEMLRQLRIVGPDTALRFVFGDTEIRCFRGTLHILPVRVPPDKGWRLEWHGERQLPVPGLGGVLRLIRQRGAGIHLPRLTEHPVTVRLRQGGERLRPDPGRSRRSLKNLLQEAALPPWEREVMPLLYSGEQLVWVPGIGVESDFQARLDDPGLMVSWECHAGYGFSGISGEHAQPDSLHQAVLSG